MDLEIPEVTIDKLAGLTDAELSKMLGFDEKLKEVREALTDMQALKGKEREFAEEKVQQRFTPNVFPEDFKWIVKDAKRSTGKGQMEDCACDSVI